MSGAAPEAGFTLIEAVAVLAIVALLAALALPRWPHGTSRPQLEALALRVAALLKYDRVAALRLHRRVDTALDSPRRRIISGAGGGEIRLPADVGFDALLAQTCSGFAVGSAIAFLPSGMSCGGAIALARPGASYKVRVNWLTGGVEVAAADPPR